MSWNHNHNSLIRGVSKSDNMDQRIKNIIQINWNEFRNEAYTRNKSQNVKHYHTQREHKISDSFPFASHFVWRERTHPHQYKLSRCLWCHCHWSIQLNFDFLFFQTNFINFQLDISNRNLLLDKSETVRYC